MEEDKYLLKVPLLERNKTGVTNGYNNADTISFSSIYVASANDTADIINEKISSPGMHLVL